MLYRWTQRNRNGETNGVLKLTRMGLDVFEEYFYTSAQASVPGCSAYVIGEAGLLNARYDEGIIMNDIGPNYAVVGESKAYFCGKPKPLMIRTRLRRDSYIICGLNGTPVQSNTHSAEASAACTQRSIHWKGMTV